MKNIKRVRCIAFILFLSLLAGEVFAQENKKLVSVFPFQPVDVSKTDAVTLTGLFETALVNTQVVRVVEQTDAEKILKSVERSLSECVDEKCAIEIGKQLAADNVFLGKVSRIGNSYVVNVKLIDVAKGENLGAKSVSASFIGGLVDKMESLAYLMVAGEETAGTMVLEVVEETGTEKEAPSSAQEVKAQKTYVTFKSSPPGVELMVYDMSGKLLFKGRTPVPLRLTLGSYRIEASCPLYYGYRKTLNVNVAQKLKYTIQMKPNFGSVEIKSDPSGADVLLDGLKVGTTPFSKDELKSKSYDFIIKKDLYAPKSLALQVEDGKTARASVRLVPEFIELAVSENKGLSARLYVDGSYKGTLPYKCKFSYRSFTIRVVPSDSRYHEYTEKIPVRKRGEKIERSITLKGKYGTVAVETDPFIEGTVIIDGKRMGTSPDQFRLLEGEHEIKVEGLQEGKKIAGFRKVRLKEGDDIEVKLLLKPVDSKLIINTEPGYAKVYLDGSYKGTSSLTIEAVKPGYYRVKVEKQGYQPEEKGIMVKEGEDQNLSFALKKVVIPENMVLVEAGSFQMGSTSGDSDEKPVHRVTISKPFYIGKYEVTQKQWREVMGSNPSYFKGDNLPVEKVSWYDAVAYCNRLSKKEGLTPCYSGSGKSTRCDFSANGYRLPTEAEWEYAVRGGKESRGYKYAGSNSAGDVAWYDSNSGNKTHEVGSKKANELGIYDMSGNVWEWCWDWKGSYSSSSQADPKGASSGEYRVLRGGSWYFDVWYVRSADRYDFTPDNSIGYFGFSGGAAGAPALLAFVL